MFVLLGISILLAALLALNSLSSLALAALWHILGGFTRRWPAALRARVLFLLRIGPALSAIFFVALFFVPSYLAYEPRVTTEGVSLKLAALAAASLIGLTLAILRAIASWRATARLTADWLLHAEPVCIAGLNIPAFCFEHAFPIIAIVGVIRPKLFIARRVLNSLTEDEIAAAIAHECGHLAARDNLKRGSLRACRDALLIIPCGRALDCAWSEASECAADEYAAREGRKMALDLASALVKIARMIPCGVRPTMPAGVFLIGDDEGSSLKSRVRRLIELAAQYNPRLQPKLSLTSLIWIIAGFVVISSAVLANTHMAQVTVHSFIEHAVAFLT
jgi:Zn-dependent protease with chaperone function